MNQAMETNEDEGKKSEAKKESFKTIMTQKLFQVYFEIMKERNTDSNFAAILIIVTFVQLYGLLYYSRVEFPFRDDLYDTIAGICDLMRIYPMLEESRSGTYYWALAYTLIFILAAYIVQLIYVDYSIRIQKFYFNFPVKLLQYLSSFVFWIMLQPIVEIFISIYSCDSDGYHKVDATLKCWSSGLHIYYIILFTISLLLYIVIAILVSFFYNESRPYYTDALARLDCNFELYLTLYRVFVSIIGHFFTHYDLQWVLVGMHLLGSANFCKMYLKYLPYYNVNTSVIFGAGWFSYFWISLNLLLTKALENVQYEGQTIVIIIGLVLVLPATK